MPAGDPVWTVEPKTAFVSLVPKVGYPLEMRVKMAADPPSNTPELVIKCTFGTGSEAVVGGIVLTLEPGTADVAKWAVNIEERQMCVHMTDAEYMDYCQE